MYYYYYPDGSQIENPNEFVRFYNMCYYLTNSTIVEKRIEKLLYRGKDQLERADIVYILAWKMNGLNQRASSIEVPFVFKKYREDTKLEWNLEVNKEKAVNYGNQVRSEQEDNIKRLVDCVLKNSNKNKWNDIDASAVLDSLQRCVDGDNKKDSKIKGIGHVYLITLLYFITQGAYPIYDIHVMKALTAIKSKDIRLGGKISVRNLPIISHPDFWKTYLDYIKSLEAFSKSLYNNDKNQYKYDRNIDRALWVYGHLFK